MQLLALSLTLLSNQVSLQHAMDVVANNVANVNTTGFKREGLDFASLVDRATYRDLSNGPIESSGNPLDIAIQGSGYFQVQTPMGMRYSRDGSLLLDNQGQIVTHGGYPVLTDSGQPITVPETATEVNIGADGTVSVKNGSDTSLSQLGRIGLVSFSNEQALKAEGSNLYSTNQLATPATTSTVVQGALEKSNVEPVMEMTEMIKIMRLYEQSSNLISQEHTRLNDAYTRLSKTSA